MERDQHVLYLKNYQPFPSIRRIHIESNTRDKLFKSKIHNMIYFENNSAKDIKQNTLNCPRSSVWDNFI